MKKRWYDYLWIASLAYLVLGFFNILFAWLGLLCFFIPLLFAVGKGSKGYCNRYCGRGQLFGLLGGRFGLSRKKDMPLWMKSKWFRYGFLVFFFVMFFQMLWNTYLVFDGARELRQTVTLLWTFRVPWHWAYSGTAVPAWAAQFAFGFYSVMLTSTILGFVTMILYKPRSWCVYCPMGTMTQLICRARNGEAGKRNEAREQRQEIYKKEDKKTGGTEMGLFDFLKGIDIDQKVNECRATEGAVLLDVRTEQEYREGHIPGSRNVPLQALEQVKTVTAKKNTPIFVYCYSGSRSRQAATMLERMGYTKVSNAGGIASYTGKVE